MAFAVGYNIGKAQQLTEDISSAYQELSTTISQKWDEVVTVLQNNWVGEDEQSFEATFAKKINTLYSNANTLTKSAIDAIEGLTQSWHTFQKTNVLEGGETVSSGSFSFTRAVIPENSELVALKQVDLSENTDRGLATESSAGNIKTSVEGYVQEVKSKAETLFDSIVTDSAFFGEQASSIKDFIKKTGDAVAEVSVAVKDLHEALDKVAGQNYTASTASVQETMQTGMTTLESNLTELGSSRWS